MNSIRNLLQQLEEIEEKPKREKEPGVSGPVAGGSKQTPGEQRANNQLEALRERRLAARKGRTNKDNAAASSPTTGQMALNMDDSHNNVDFKTSESNEQDFRIA